MGATCRPRWQCPMSERQVVGLSRIWQRLPPLVQAMGPKKTDETRALLVLLLAPDICELLRGGEVHLAVGLAEPITSQFRDGRGFRSMCSSATRLSTRPVNSCWPWSMMTMKARLLFRSLGGIHWIAQFWRRLREPRRIRRAACRPIATRQSEPPSAASSSIVSWMQVPSFLGS